MIQGFLSLNLSGFFITLHSQLRKGTKAHYRLKHRKNEFAKL
ncbi:hypothetical protein [Campylobacter troglodytis]|nr:hypothetical protein [Campylobacter troglodytis]